MSENPKKEKFKKLLNYIQDNFPLHPRPFQVLSKKFKLSEKEIIDYLKQLKEKNIIRHFGATINSHKLKYTTCLCATSIPENKIDIAYKIAELPEITHAYLREHKLNFWFTIISKSEEDLLNIIQSLEKTYSLKIKAFPATKKFKVKAVFKL